MTAMTGNLYTAMWKFKDAPGSHRGNFVCPNLAELLRILNKSEGVNTQSTECIYVHQHFSQAADGLEDKILEVYSHESEIPPKIDSNVVNIVTAQLKKAAKEEAKAKPHIKLTLTDTSEPARKFVSASYGRLKAYEAI